MKVHHPAIAIGLLLASCAGPDPRLAEEPVTGTGRLQAVVLITLDTTRADHIGAWGWSHAVTPTLDRLASRGTRFTRCDTAAATTLPSHTTLMTGLYPPRHGVRDNGTFALATEIETVAERLATGGWDTAAVVGAAVLGRRYGLDQGFRKYADDLDLGAHSGQTAERSATRVTDVALELLASLEAPYFLWVHYFDAHDSYEPPAGFATSGPDPGYDGEISFVDHELDRLLAALPTATATVVVGDHGEMLGDHGEATHGVLLYSGVRRVPLIVAGPGVPSAEVDCLVRTADVAPTLLELAGLEPPDDLDGKSLLSLTRGEERCGRLAYSETFQPYFAYQWHPLRALSDGDRLYLEGTRPGLFDLEADPSETHDLAVERSDEARRWGERLADLLAAAGESARSTVEPTLRIDSEERRQLESLGYLSGDGGRGAAIEEMPDPRDMVEIATTLHETAAVVRAGGCNQALPILLRVTHQDPGNYPAFNLIGLCLLELGREESALNAFTQASARRPEAVEPIANRALALLRLDRREEAEEAYHRAFELDPARPMVASNLAALLVARGDPTAAGAVIDEAFAAGSRHAGLFLERGRLRGARGDLEGALADFEEAIEREPGNLPARENAARAAFSGRRFDRAASHLDGLLTRAPDRGDLWLNLGMIREEHLGDTNGARQAYEQALALATSPATRVQIQRRLGALP